MIVPPNSNPPSHLNPSPADAEPPKPQVSWLVRTSVFNPYLVIVVCLLIVVIGVVSLQRVPVDILPVYDTPAVQVVTLYPGMPTEFMDRTITNRIERWTGQAMGIQRQESRTMIGVSIVRDHFAEGVDPNAAFSQVTSLATADLYYLPPGTVPPMVMLYDPTAPMPTAYLAASSDVLDETKVYELAYFNVRNMLSGTPGVIAPAVFGGKLRRIYAEVDLNQLHARGLSPMDVHRAVREGVPMLPAGTFREGDTEWLLELNAMADQVQEMDAVPLKVALDSRDGSRTQIPINTVGSMRDTAAIQTNMVRILREPLWEGKQTVFIPIMRRPGSNTIEVVEGVKKSIPVFQSRLPSRDGAPADDPNPSGLNLDVVADQSIFVREAIANLTWEGILGALLASLMVLIFIGSVRSTVVIVLTIPLAVLVTVIGLYFTNNTLNLMTLGGLALVMGRLVDDPIVDIENTFRHLAMGKPPRQAALDSAMEIAMPVLVATITTVAVFFPVVFLYGMGKFLFKPLALSVGIAMFASYFLSRTLSPAYCAYFLKSHQEGEKRFWFFRWCDAGYAKLQSGYTALLKRAMNFRWGVVAGSVLLLAASLVFYPFIGQELFPPTDASQIIVNVRLPAGTSLKKTKEWISGEEEAQVNGFKDKKKVHKGIEDVIMEVIPESDRKMLLTDMGVLYDWPAGYTSNAGPMDATILIQLKEPHERQVSSQEYAVRLRKALGAEATFKDIEFAFNTGGMVSAALNFGMASPINIQVRGRNMFRQYRIAQELQMFLKDVPGAVDVRIQQAIDYPTVRIELDRDKMADLGITMEDAAKNLMSVVNSSTVFAPLIWLDYKSGNHIFLGVTVPEEEITWDNIMLTPVKGQNVSAPSQQLKNLVHKIDWERKTAVEVNHQDLARVIDIFINVEGRDVGSVASAIDKKLSEWGKKNKVEGSEVTWSVPNPEKPGEDLLGYAVHMRGEVSSMRESFQSLGFGLLLAAILIYLIMVAQFRSFLDPFIVMLAVPLGLIGVLATLFVTDTTMNVQSFLGVIFMVGIAVSNSILLVEFANRVSREQGTSPWDAAIESARVRLRPILMTSLAAIAGLFPLALHSGQATAPLARAVIGGLGVSTVLTIFVVPCLYTLVKRNRPVASVSSEL